MINKLNIHPYLYFTFAWILIVVMIQYATDYTHVLHIKSAINPIAEEMLRTLTSPFSIGVFILMLASGYYLLIAYASLTKGMKLLVAILWSYSISYFIVLTLLAIDTGLIDSEVLGELDDSEVLAAKNSLSEIMVMLTCLVLPLIYFSVKPILNLMNVLKTQK